MSNLTWIFLTILTLLAGYVLISACVSSQKLKKRKMAEYVDEHESMLTGHFTDYLTGVNKDAD